MIDAEIALVTVVGTVAAVLAVLVGTVSFIAILWHRAVEDAKREVRDRDRQIADLKIANARLESEIVDLKNKLFEVRRYYIVDAQTLMERRKSQLSESRWARRRIPPWVDEVDDMFTLVHDEPNEPDDPDDSEPPVDADD